MINSAPVIPLQGYPPQQQQMGMGGYPPQQQQIGMGGYQQQPQMGMGGYPQQQQQMGMGGYPQQQQPQMGMGGYPQQQQQMGMGGYPQQQQQMGMGGYPQQQQQMGMGGYPQQQPQMGVNGQPRRYAMANETQVPVIIAGFETCGVCMPTMVLDPPQAIEFNLNIANMSFSVSPDAAKGYLMNWVKQNCCFGTSTARDCVLTADGACNSFAIEIDTFSENRETVQTAVAYKRGEFVENPAGAGLPPQAWQMQLPPVTFFSESVTRHRIPFTSIVKPDHTCGGDGQVCCRQCGGDGRTKCHQCGGDGKQRRQTEDGGSEEVQCGHCNGSGQTKCGHCGGDGHVVCSRCHGSGLLLHYVEVIRTLKTLKSSEAVDAIPDSELPPALIVAAGGHQMASKTVQNILPPVGIAPDMDAAMARVKAAATQQVAAFKGWQHQQRLNVKCVPVSRFQAQVPNTDKKFHFFVYGTDNRVHCVDYPDTCCWGICTIA